MRFPRAANYTVPDRIIDHFKMNWEYVSCFHHANFEDNDLLKKHTPGVDLSYQIFLHFLLKDIDRIIKIGRLPPVGAGCRNQEASKDETIF